MAEQLNLFPSAHQCVVMQQDPTVFCGNNPSVCSLTLTNRYSVLLLILDTTPLGPFFNQTQSPWCVNKTMQCLRNQKHPEDDVPIRDFLSMSRESPHLKHSNIRAVWCGGQVTTTGHRVVRRLHIQLAPQDTLIIELLQSHTHAHTDQRGQVNFK